MGKVQSLFPQWYYHGEVEKHESIKAMLLYELGTATLTQPAEWNCSVSSSFESDTNQDDFSWQMFKNAINDNLTEMHDSLGGRPFCDIEMTEAWINVYHKGQSQEIHTHCGGDNTTFSCAYFLQYNPEVDGKFVFYNPSQDHHQGYFSKNYPCTNTWFPEVREGDIIIFPSYLHHQVAPQPQSDSARITVSANFRVK